LIGNGFFVWKQKNVIVRNLKISKVRAANGDAVGIQASSHVWVDHCDLSSDQAHGKNYYDGLLDVTHASDFVTISNTHFHDHFKGSLVGHSDKNGQEDTGHLRITFYNNFWTNVHSRAPSLRFGTGHVFNSYFSNVTDGINCRDDAQLLVQNNVFVNSTKPLYSTKGGYAIAKDNDFGGSQNTALQGKLSSVPYKYHLEPPASVKSITRSVGNTLSFGGR
jgi:pectate lyase